MIKLPHSIAAWGAPEFSSVFKREAESLAPALLPLQQGLRLSSVVADSPFGVVLLAAEEDSGLIRVKAGIFYSGIIAGCSCADDPTPLGEQTEYCEVLFAIDRASGEASVTLMPESAQ